MLAKLKGAAHVDGLWLVICDGDSLTMSTSTPYPSMMRALLPSSARCPNIAFPGDGLAQRITAFPLKVPPLPKPGVWSCAAVVWAGTNDIAMGASAADTYAMMTTLVGLYVALGIPVVVCDVIARGDWYLGSPEIAAAFNALLLSGWASIGATALVRLSLTFTDPNDPVLYDSGHVHLTDAGNAIVAAQVGAAVRGIVE